MKSLLKNKKGDIQGIIGLVVVVLMLLIMSPLLMKMVITPLEKFGSALENVDASNKSAEAVNYTKNKFISLFDWVVMFFFLFDIVLLFITAFLVDVHPAFLIVYVIALFFLVIFAPNVLDSVNTLWDMPQFNTEVTYLPLLNFVREHFMFIMLGIAITTGLIMYGKYRLTQGGSSREAYY